MANLLVSQTVRYLLDNLANVDNPNYYKDEEEAEFFRDLNDDLALHFNHIKEQLPYIKRCIAKKLAMDFADKTLEHYLIDVKKIGGDNQEEVCAVCLEELYADDGKLCKSSPCLHKFHGECIKSWLMLKNHCPICRSPVFVVACRNN